MIGRPIQVKLYEYFGSVLRFMNSAAEAARADPALAWIRWFRSRQNSWRGSEFTASSLWAKVRTEKIPGSKQIQHGLGQKTVFEGWGSRQAGCCHPCGPPETHGASRNRFCRGLPQGLEQVVRGASGSDLPIHAPPTDIRSLVQPAAGSPRRSSHS